MSLTCLFNRKFQSRLFVTTWTASSGNNNNVSQVKTHQAALQRVDIVGVMELGDSAVVGSVVAEGVFGRPHTRDSVVLTCLSLVIRSSTCSKTPNFWNDKWNNNITLSQYRVRQSIRSHLTMTIFRQIDINEQNELYQLLSIS